MSYSAKSATPVSKELVLLLSKDHDLKTTSELTGVSYDNVRQIVSRHERKVSSQSVTIPSAPSQIISETVERIRDRLASNEKQTRLSLSRAHRLHAARAARGKLAPKETLQVAQGAAITHGWRSQKDNDQASVAVNIAILSV